MYPMYLVVAHHPTHFEPELIVGEVVARLQFVGNAGIDVDAIPTVSAEMVRHALGMLGP